MGLNALPNHCNDELSSNVQPGTSPIRQSNLELAEQNPLTLEAVRNFSSGEESDEFRRNGANQDSSLDRFINTDKSFADDPNKSMTMAHGNTGKDQRGFITNYLTSLSTDQIIENTLTGFLASLIRKRGNLMQFSNISAYT